MSGSIQLVRPGIYRVRVYVGENKTKSRTFAAPNMREARKLAAEYEVDIRRGVTATAVERGTMAELVDMWMAHQEGQRRSPTTLYRVRPMVARIRERFGDMQVRSLTAADVDAFYAELRRVVVAAANPKKGTPERTMGESTVHHYHRVLSAILRYGVRHDKLDIAVTTKAERPKPDKYDAPMVSDQVMQQLFATAPVPIQLAITVEAMMGLRRGELFGLRWRDLQGGMARISNNTVVVPGSPLIDKVTKGNRSRQVPVVPALQVALAALRDGQEAEAARHGVKLAPDARIMANQAEDPTGRIPHSPEWLSRAWTRHTVAAGHHVRLHDLRHWCASQMLRDGVPVNVVQEILGHASATTTMSTYAHVIAGSLDHARDVLAGRGAMLGLLAPAATLSGPGTTKGTGE